MADDVDLLQDKEDMIEMDEGPALPAGTQNLITQAGYEAFAAELNRLTQDRPDLVRLLANASANVDITDGADFEIYRQKLRNLDNRIRYIAKRMDGFKVVNTAEQRQKDPNKVYFGATVKYEDEDGKHHKATIVGVDEANAGEGRISWLSPLGRALLGAGLDEEVELRAPRGSRSLHVLEISY